MKLSETTYEEIGRRLVGLVKAAEVAGHKRVKSSADHDAMPAQDDVAGNFVVDVFTKTVPEITEKYFGE